jgi:hypothetical protein
MSKENVEIVRRAWEQWQRSDETLDAIPVELYVDDVEWDISSYPTVDLPSRGSGRDKLLDLFGTYFSGWTSYQTEVTQFIDAQRIRRYRRRPPFRERPRRRSPRRATSSRSGRFVTA